MAEFNAGKVHKFDHEGNLLKIFNLPSGRAAFLEIRDDKLYVTNQRDTIYVKSVCNDDDDFVVFVNNQVFFLLVSGLHLMVAIL